MSAEMALAQAEKFGWGAVEELLLYLIHGTLHLVGYDDLTPEEAAKMRAAEARYLQQLGLPSQPALLRDDASPIKGGTSR